MLEKQKGGKSEVVVDPHSIGMYELVRRASRTLSLIVEGSVTKLLITCHSRKTMNLLSLRNFARSNDKRYRVDVARE